MTAERHPPRRWTPRTAAITLVVSARSSPCTFSEEGPHMSALRRRLVPTLLLALFACPAVAAGSPRADVHGDPLPPGARGRLGTTRLWHGPAVTRLVFAPDGRTFFSAADDAVVCQWDAATGKLVRTFAHPKNVLGVALSPDGKLMATSAADNAVRLWLVATAQELQKW